MDNLCSLHFSLPPTSVCHTQYTGEIQDKFDKTDITLADITILTPADKNQLNDFASSATDLDMSAVTQEVGARIFPLLESLGQM